MQPIITLIANAHENRLSDDLVHAIANSIDAQEIVWLSPGEAVELHLPVSAGTDLTAKQVKPYVSDQKIDYVYQTVDPENRRKKILIADMDSTMIQQECIDELAAEAGIKQAVAGITARAMNGEIAFDAALRERIGLLKGLPSSVIADVIKNRIHLMPGAKELVATMRANGAYCALVSGGFTDFTAHIAKALGFSEHRANRLVHEDELLAGTVEEPILGSEAKAQALSEIASAKGLTPHDAIAVGDGANDLPMLKMAGMGVALHAKPIVAEQARIRIDHSDLRALLFLQGYRSDEFTH